MTTNPLEILSAFLDGEPVDPGELAAALSAPGAREALRDFALIRAELLSDESRPGAEFYREMERRLEPPAPRRPWWAAVVPVPAFAVAATMLVLVVLGVWAAKSTGVPAPRASELPPVPDRVVVLQPGIDWTSNSGPSAGSHESR